MVGKVAHAYLDRCLITDRKAVYERAYIKLFVKRSSFEMSIGVQVRLPPSKSFSTSIPGGHPLVSKRLKYLPALEK